METRTQAERLVVIVGAVVTAIAIALFGLAVYSLIGPVGLSGSAGYDLVLLVFVAVATTILYASSGVENLFEGQYRRRM